MQSISCTSKFMKLKRIIIYYPAKFPVIAVQCEGHSYETVLTEGSQQERPYLKIRSMPIKILSLAKVTSKNDQHFLNSTIYIMQSMLYNLNVVFNFCLRIPLVSRVILWRNQTVSSGSSICDMPFVLEKNKTSSVIHLFFIKKETWYAKLEKYSLFHFCPILKNIDISILTSF